MTTKNTASNRPIIIGVSSCLLGARVRFDGQHKRERYIADILGDYLDFLSICPEIGAGMGIPRESVQLRGNQDSPRLIGNKSGKNWTLKLKSFSRERISKKDFSKLSGFIFKKNSPSCGMERVRLYDDKGSMRPNGIGVFARAVMEKYPFLPVEEEGRLNDIRTRENFIERIFAYYCLDNLFNGGYSGKKIIEFHTVSKYLILSHSQKHYTELGKLVAKIKQYTPAQFKKEYSRLYMEALKIKTTVKKQVNVLQHIFGFLKDYLNSEDKKYLLEVINDYHKNLVPLVVPVTLLKLFILRHGVTYIANQIYLNPHPKELMLRNHV
ncbi:MAG: DUF523 and DUF1722 domain-containing protein [candidate division Zixibacteria bacterium]